MNTDQRGSKTRPYCLVTRSIYESNYAVLEKAGIEPVPVLPSRPAEAYLELIRRLFQTAAAVAIVGGTGLRPGRGLECVRESPAELAASRQPRGRCAGGHAAAHEPVPVPGETAYAPGPAQNVWFWPAPSGAPIEFFKSRVPVGTAQLARFSAPQFNSILLDCPAPETAPGSAEIAAMGGLPRFLRGGRRPDDQTQIRRDQAPSGRGCQIGRLHPLERR